ncbi:zinc finger, CCHC-type containing protein [Tanacetum coccineum]
MNILRTCLRPVESRMYGVPIHRSARIPQVPDRYGNYVDIEEYEIGDIDEPPNYKAALADLESDKWLEAMNMEMILSKSNLLDFLVLYVDDILLMGNSVAMLQEVKSWLCKCFSMKDLGEAAYILGIKIIRDRSKMLTALRTVTSKILVRFTRMQWKTILKYLRNTKDMVLVYGAKPEDELKVSYGATAQNTNNTTIRSEGKLVHLEQPLAPLPYPVVSQAARDAYDTLLDAHNEVACLMLGKRQSVSSYILKMKSNLDTLKCLGYAMPKELGVSLILNSLNKDYDQFVQNYNTHSMGKTLAELHAMLKVYKKGIPKKAETSTVLAI